MGTKKADKLEPVGFYPFHDALAILSAPHDCDAVMACSFAGATCGSAGGESFRLETAFHSSRPARATDLPNPPISLATTISTSPPLSPHIQKHGRITYLELIANQFALHRMLA